jgi:Ca-activated chloride channel homolog
MRTRRTSLRTGKPASLRRGAMLIFITVFLFAFVAIIAFSVDVAYMHLSRTQLKTAADASARAAGEALSRTQSVSTARQAAKDIAQLNYIDGVVLTLDDSDIVTGNSTKQANGKYAFTAGGSPTNGFYVTGRKLKTAPSGAVNLWFGPLFGMDQWELIAHAACARFDRDIMVVVDRSSSMKLYTTDSDTGMSLSDWRCCAVAQPQSKWVALQGAVSVFIAQLANTTQKEHVGLVSFGSDFSYCSLNNPIARVDQNLTETTSLVNTAMNNITNTKFNGNTAIGTGLQYGINALNDATYARPYSRKTIVLMTDGIENTGVSCNTVADTAAAQGITVYTITYGAEGVVDSALMQSVANKTGGKYYHAPDETSLVAAFKEIALSLSVIITE